MDVAALANRAAEADPMSNGPVTTIPGRLLLADGDGLCYYCAGNDDTAPGLARANMIEKLRSAARAAGAEAIKVLTTSRGCHKGYRYAVARVKPYQGQRADNRRPKNWEFLRGLLEGGDLGYGIEVEFTSVAEADDLFSRYALNHPDCVIYTQDKDMHMVPGWHLDWTTHLMLHLAPGVWLHPSHDAAKPFGRAWFWQQMLQGDGADNIPGLPFYKDGSIVGSGPNKGKAKEIRVGEPPKDTVGTATKLLANVSSDMGATLLLQGLYQTCYGERWLVEMLEQGILLWMRNDQQSSALNVVAPGNPLHALTTHALYPAARAEIMARIAEAVVHETTEDNGSSSGEGEFAHVAERAVCNMQTALLDCASGAGSQSQHGDCASSPAPGVQCGARQGGELVQEVRRPEPVGVPQWARRLLAKA